MYSRNLRQSSNRNNRGQQGEHFKNEISELSQHQIEWKQQAEQGGDQNIKGLRIYCELKSLINIKPDTLSNCSDFNNFAVAIEKAICYRNNILLKLKEFTEQNLSTMQDTEKRKENLVLIDLMRQSNATLIVTGRLKSGKSMLVTELLNREIVLPSSDEPTTQRITGLFYSDTPALRVLEDGVGYPAKPVSDVTKDVLTEFINPQNSIENEEDSENNSFVEIGIPSKIMKNGLNILDCPGWNENYGFHNLENELLSKISPPIICYLFDADRGFNLEDEERIETIRNRLEKYSKEYPVMIVSNKTRIDEEDRFDEPSQAPETSPVDSRCSCQISTGELTAMRYESVSDYSVRKCQIQFIQFKNKLIQAIIDQVRTILETLLQSIERKDFILWIKLQSLLVDKEFIDIYKNEKQFEERVFNFTSGFQIHAMKYRSEDYQVITIQNIQSTMYKEEKLKLFDLLQQDSGIIVHECERESELFIILKMPFKRLIDCLEILDMSQILFFINELTNREHIFRSTKYGDVFDKRCINFRPDNLYIDDEGNVFENKFIPNNAALSFLLKDNQAVPPFHLHPQLRSEATQPDYDSLTDSNCLAQYIYSFGWSVWILLEGSGYQAPTICNENNLDIDNWLNLLKSGRFSTYLPSLREVLIMCWSVPWNDSFDQIQKYWKTIQNKINSFSAMYTFMKAESQKLPAELIDLVIGQCSNDDNLLLQFSQTQKIFALIYQGEKYQVTQILNVELSNYDEEKKRLKRIKNGEKNLTHSYITKDKKPIPWLFYIFEMEDESALFLIEKLPHKRLMDCLEEFDFSQIQHFIKKIIDIADAHYNQFERMKSFRPDNVYIDENGELYFNHFISNHSNFLFLKNKQTAPPFHIHPNLKNEPDSKSSTIRSKFLHSIGWLIWCLVEGTGCSIPDGFDVYDTNHWLKSLQSGRFPDYPVYLRDVMIKCWNVERFYLLNDFRSIMILESSNFSDGNSMNDIIKTIKKQIKLFDVYFT